MLQAMEGREASATKWSGKRSILRQHPSAAPLGRAVATVCCRRSRAGKGCSTAAPALQRGIRQGPQESRQLSAHLRGWSLAQMPGDTSLHVFSAGRVGGSSLHCGSHQPVPSEAASSQAGWSPWQGFTTSSLIPPLPRTAPKPKERLRTWPLSLKDHVAAGGIVAAWVSAEPLPPLLSWHKDPGCSSKSRWEKCWRIEGVWEGTKWQGTKIVAPPWY